MRDDHDPMRDEARAVFARMLPWAASLIGHMAVVVLAVLAVFFIGELRVEDEPAVIPSIRLSDDPARPLQAVEAEALDESSSPRAVVRVHTQSVVSTPSEAPLVIAVEGGLPTAGDPFRGDPGVGVGDGFFGARPGGDVRSIVFVIDASGSLVDTYPFVIDELKRSIRELTDEQSFHVLFFTGRHDGPLFALGQRQRMFRGTRADRQRVIDWIDVDAHHIELGGQGDAVAALQAALSFRPDLVFLLSDDITGRGRYEVNRERLLREVADANRSDTMISTIQFLYPDPVAPQDTTRWTLRRMAEASGGTFKYVSPDELNLR